jgi:two-component system, OmpR family, response regulator ChvI
MISFTYLQPSQQSSDNDNGINSGISIKAKRSQYNNRVLVVDDDPDITNTFKIGLEESGFKVDVFNDPIQALSKFEKQKDEQDISSSSSSSSSYSHYHYDLLLLDVRMPKMNGFELYREINKKISEGGGDKVKVCFITAYEVYYESLKEDFPALNVGCFIKKPVEIQQLVKRIRTELEEEN